MPKLVYACDHCGQFFVEDKIYEHQDKCDYNPKNKRCASCKFCRDRKIYDGPWLISSSLQCYFNLKKEKLQPNQVFISDGEPTSQGHTCEHWEKK